MKNVVRMSKEGLFKVADLEFDALDLSNVDRIHTDRLEEYEGGFDVVATVCHDENRVVAQLVYGRKTGLNYIANRALATENKNQKN